MSKNQTVGHAHHCTARHADGFCEECEVHAENMAEQQAEQTQHTKSAASPDLSTVIAWLEAGCDPMHAAAELRIISQGAGAPQAVLITECKALPRVDALRTYRAKTGCTLLEARNALFPGEVVKAIQHGGWRVAPAQGASTAFDDWAQGKGLTTASHGVSSEWTGLPIVREAYEAGATWAAVPVGFAIVPIRMNEEMQRIVSDEEGWQWEDLLAAANSVTESDYEAISRGDITDGEIESSFAAYGAPMTAGHLEAVREILGNAAAPAHPPEGVQPSWLHVECADPDHSVFYEWQDRADAYSRAATHNGTVRNLYTHHAQPAAQGLDAQMLNFISDKRVALTPEYDGPWKAEVFADEAEPVITTEGNTVRDAVSAALAAQAKQGGA